VNRAYGSADLEREAPLNTGSIFDIGSVRKVMAFDYSNPIVRNIKFTRLNIAR
jgi:hypothetical protein